MVGNIVCIKAIVIIPGLKKAKAKWCRAIAQLVRCLWQSEITQEVARVKMVPVKDSSIGIIRFKPGGQIISFGFAFYIIGIGGKKYLALCRLKQYNRNKPGIS